MNLKLPKEQENEWERKNKADHVYLFIVKLQFYWFYTNLRDELEHVFLCAPISFTIIEKKTTTVIYVILNGFKLIFI